MFTSNCWTLCVKRRPSAAIRLFCFPHAGVGTSVFRGWTEELGENVEVWMIQLPGREGRWREGLFQSVETVVPPLAMGIKDLLDQPFAFYGHSLGGTIAFEVTRWLRREANMQPNHFFVGASPAPQLPWKHAPLHTLDDEELLREIDRRYGGIPLEIIKDAEMRALILPVLRADVTMVETYKYTEDASLDCRITAIGGTEDCMVTRQELQAWEMQTASDFQLVMTAGNHLFLQTHKSQLIELISNEMRASREIRCASPENLTSRP